MVTADTEPVTVENKIQWFNDHHELRPLLIIEIQNTIAGWISFQDFYGRPAYNQTAEISIYIHEDFRGKGLGTLALKHGILKSPILGIKNLLGFIFEHNHQSIHLFKRKGFEQWGKLPKVAFLDGIERSLTIFGKRI